MRVRNLEIFYSVYRYKTISAAAAALHISQPAMSKALKHAEDQFGFALFTRTGRGLIPTSEAHRLYEDVKRIFDDVAQVRRTCLDLQRSGGGRLKVSTVTGLSFELLPRAISRMREVFPDISFEIQTLHYGDLISSLRSFDTDIGLVFEAPIHDGLERVELGRGEFACVSAGDVGADALNRIQIDTLSGENYIALNPNGPLGGKLDLALERAAIKSAPVAIAESCFVAKSLVACGLGTTIVDEFTALAPGFDGLTSVRLTPPISIRIDALHISARPPTGVGQQFLAAVKAELEVWRENHALD